MILYISSITKIIVYYLSFFVLHYEKWHLPHPQAQAEGGVHPTSKSIPNWLYSWVSLSILNWAGVNLKTDVSTIMLNENQQMIEISHIFYQAVNTYGAVNI